MRTTVHLAIAASSLIFSWGFSGEASPRSQAAIELAAVEALVLELRNANGAIECYSKEERTKAKQAIQQAIDGYELASDSAVNYVLNAAVQEYSENAPLSLLLIEGILKCYSWKHVSPEPTRNRIFDFVLRDVKRDGEKLAEWVDRFHAEGQYDFMSLLGQRILLEEMDTHWALEGLVTWVRGVADPVVFGSGDPLLRMRRARSDFDRLRSTSIDRDVIKDLERILLSDLRIEEGALDQGVHSQLPAIARLIVGAGPAKERLELALSNLAAHSADSPDLHTKKWLEGSVAVALLSLGLNRKNANAALKLAESLSNLLIKDPEYKPLRHLAVTTLFLKPDAVFGPASPIGYVRLQTHVVFAKSFESQESDAGDQASGPFSAVYHWAAAWGVEKQLSTRYLWESDLEACANSHVTAGRLNEAADIFLAAAERNLLDVRHGVRNRLHGAKRAIVDLSRCRPLTDEQILKKKALYKRFLNLERDQPEDIFDE